MDDQVQQPHAPPPPPGTVPLPVRKPDEVPYALVGLLSYLSIFCLVPLFVCAPKSFEKYHAVQGTLLLVLSSLALGVSWALPPAVGSVAFSSVAVLTVLYTVIGTRNVLYGVRDPLPLLRGLTAALHLTA